jgi:hypothetical protein
MNYLQFLTRFLIFFTVVILLDWFILDYFFQTEKNNFILNLKIVYAVLLGLSFLICTILFIVYKRNFDIVGYVFLVLTTIKMVFTYWLGRPLLLQNEVLPIEKNHFFLLFFAFLLIETLLTILLLNKNQEK